MAAHVDRLTLRRPSMTLPGALWRRAAATPISDARFWLVQGLVFSVAGLHNALERIESMPESELLCFVPTSFFFMPVVVAAAFFGMRGSIATAAWCALLTLPNTLFLHTGFERYGEVVQLGFVGFAALFLGARVDQERRAYASLAAVSRALELSQSRYRDLFASAGEGILVLDDEGRVVECNEAARALTGSSFGRAHNPRLGEMFSAEAAAHIAALAANPGARSQLMRVTARDGRTAWVEPVCSHLGQTTQVLLRDVTRQRQRQADLEMYTAHIHRAQEDERRRIAQEIHDETVQSLILLCRELDEVDTSLAGGRGGERLSRVRAQTEEIIERLRALIRGLRPPLLDDLGLAPSVQRLLDDVSSHSPVRTDLEVSGSVWRAPPPLELAMLRIAQEAITNSARHGAPKRLRVGIAYEPGAVSLSIADDGKGFQPLADESELVRNGHWGIAGMQERARESGASLVIESAPGAGTTVRATFKSGPKREAGG